MSCLRNSGLGNPPKPQAQARASQGAGLIRDVRGTNASFTATVKVQSWTNIVVRGAAFNHTVPASSSPPPLHADIPCSGQARQ